MNIVVYRGEVSLVQVEQSLQSRKYDGVIRYDSHLNLWDLYCFIDSKLDTIMVANNQGGWMKDEIGDSASDRISDWRRREVCGLEDFLKELREIIPDAEFIEETE